MSQLQLEREQASNVDPAAAGPETAHGPAPGTGGAAHDGAPPAAAGHDAAAPAGGGAAGGAAGAWEADDGLMDAMGLGDAHGDHPAGDAEGGQGKATGPAQHNEHAKRGGSKKKSKAGTASTPGAPAGGAAHGAGAAHGGAVHGTGDAAKEAAGAKDAGGAVPVQKRELPGAPGGVESIHETASSGISGSGGSLPHLGAIQHSFGHYDVSGVSAHTDGAAVAANRSMGAEAYATGNHVAFGSASPSLHTAAHEAAHVVQQRGGVQLKGGVGESGDAHERHADAVADRVVQGKSASDLLDQYAPSGGAAGGGVQHKLVQFDIKADLRKAMEGWGTDEQAIFARIERATVPELQAVMADAALMGELRSELSRGDMERVLDGLRVPVKDKLRLAMSGWGSDDVYIQRTLMQASPTELADVAADQALVNQLQKELSHDDMRRVLNRLAMPLARKLEFAVAGWGTDEAYLFQSCQNASAADVIAVANNNALIAKVDGDLSGTELDQWRGIMARRLHEAGQDALAFRMCKGSDGQRRARLLWIGDVTVQRAVCDSVILSSTDGDTVRQAFQSYWEVELTVTAGASTWPVATLQAMHRQLKLLPDQDTRSRVWRELQLTSDPSLINRAAYGGGVFSVGSNASTGSTIPMGYGTKLAVAAAVGATSIQVEENRFAVGNTIALDCGEANEETVTISAISGTTYTVSTTTKPHAKNSYVGTSGGGGLRNVNWLDATVRHEIAHSVDGIVDCSGFKQGIGGWWSGGDFDSWATAMGSPWGSGTISDDDKAEIKKKIEEYVHGAKGTLTTLPADHAIQRNWGIPVIAAAEACLSQGDNFFNAPTTLYQANGKVFSCSAWYKVFQYCNTGVMQDRLSNYTLYAAAEFFAETYTVFYEEAGLGVTDAQLGRHVKNASWAAWIRTNVHERGHAPAAPGGGSGPGAPPAPAAGVATAGATPGDGKAGGASHGRKANNPN